MFGVMGVFTDNCGSHISTSLWQLFIFELYLGKKKSHEVLCVSVCVLQTVLCEVVWEAIRSAGWCLRDLGQMDEGRPLSSRLKKN